MYILNLNALKDKLIQGELSQKSQFLYLFTTFFLLNLVMELSIYFPSCEDATNFDYFDSILNMLIWILGIYFAYTANRADKGKYFLQRYISISFVVTTRYMLFILIPIAFILGIGVSVLAQLLDVDMSFFSNYENIIVPLLIDVWYLALTISVIKHIKEVAENYIKE